jgi:hypothetical protein
VGQALALGTLTVGVLDLLDAVIFFGLRGVPATAILRSIASGLLGPAAFDGGAATAALGVLLHFIIAFLIVLTYRLVSGWLPLLVREPIGFGALYGVAVYLTMTLVVVPISAAGSGPPALPEWPVLANGLLIHILGVGVPSALFARASAPQSTWVP